MRQNKIFHVQTIEEIMKKNEQKQCYTPARQCSKLSESYACKSHLRRKFKKIKKITDKPIKIN